MNNRGTPGPWGLGCQILKLIFTEGGTVGIFPATYVEEEEEEEGSR